MENMSDNKHYRQSILLGLFIGMGFAVAFGICFFVSSLTLLPTVPTINRNRLINSDHLLLGEVEHLLSNVYLRELPEDTTLEYGAIHGLIETLHDPPTLFIEPPVAQSESQALAGTYGGIGVQVKQLESGQFAIYPFDDSPAYQEGLRDDDILIKIDALVLEQDLQIDVIDQLLRGEVIDENGVNLVVERDGQEQIEAFIQFQVINVPSVISRVISEDSRIGYIQILRFTSRTPDELDIEIKNLMESDVSAIMIDLKNNSGGLLIESIEVADKFLSDGTIVIEKTRDSKEIHSANDVVSIDTTIPIVILVNGRTASASELVAGALQDNGRGILIGQQTYGKGTVQQIFPLSDGSSVHITSAEWLTPNERQIDQNGLTPDIVMIPDENGRDVEFGEAVRYLNTILDKQSK